MADIIELNGKPQKTDIEFAVEPLIACKYCGGGTWELTEGWEAICLKCGKHRTYEDEC